MGEIFIAYVFAYTHTHTLTETNMHIQTHMNILSLKERSMIAMEKNIEIEKDSKRFNASQARTWKIIIIR